MNLTVTEERRTFCVGYLRPPEVICNGLIFKMQQGIEKKNQTVVINSTLLSGRLIIAGYWKRQMDPHNRKIHKTMSNGKYFLLTESLRKKLFGR